MKNHRKFTFCLQSVFLVLLLFSSCTRDSSVDEALLHKADAVSNIPVVEEPDEYMGDYLPETEYAAGDLSQTEGIWYDGNIGGLKYAGALAEGKYYFNVNTFQTRVNDDGSRNMGTAKTVKSINLETGEDFFLCPDPLCTHISSVCAYTDMDYVGYYNGLLYFRKYTYPEDIPAVVHTVESLDPADGSFTVILENTQDFLAESPEELTIVQIIGNRLLYIIETTEADKENRTETRTPVRYMMDLDTGEVQILPDDGYNLKYISGNTAYSYSSQESQFVRTDTESGSRTVIPLPARYPAYLSMQVDENTGEVFVLLQDETGTNKVLSRMTGDALEILTMPHENITAFQITRDFIYYSAYEPVDIGESENGGRKQVEDGGKIYRTDRKTREKAELIFSDGIEFAMWNWFVLGDNLYLDSVAVVEEGGYVYYAPSRSLKHVRIHLENHTARYFRYD